VDRDRLQVLETQCVELNQVHGTRRVRTASRFCRLRFHKSVKSFTVAGPRHVSFPKRYVINVEAFLGTTSCSLSREPSWPFCLRSVRRQLVYDCRQNVVRQMVQKLRDCAESFPATRATGTVTPLPPWAGVGGNLAGMGQYVRRWKRQVYSGLRDVIYRRV
jgi:hypothetical protein